MKRKLSVQESAVQMVDSALVSHNLPDQEHDDLVIEVATALKVKKPSKAYLSDEGNCFICAEAPKGQRHMTCLKCSRVFHVDCIRPRLVKEPKSGYTCAFCSSEKDGDNSEAKMAMRLQLRLKVGLDSGNGETLERGVKGAELVVTKSGKRFCAKKVAKGQIIELARCEEIGGALQALVSDPHYKGCRSDNAEMWCTGCLDDPSVEHCCFCGCRRCYGKHDSSNILVCDGCDEEWHIYCLDPPLHSVPRSSEWFCKKCTLRIEKERAARALKNDARRSDSVADKVDPKKKVKSGRGRGRPPGSGKKAKLAAAKEGAEREEEEEAKAPALMSAPTALGPSPAAHSGASGNGDVEQRSRASSLMDTEAPQLDAVGMGAALAIIAKIGPDRTLSMAEKDFLAQLRVWAPYSDLRAVKEALVLQCSVLQKKLASLN